MCPARLILASGACNEFRVEGFSVHINSVSKTGRHRSIAGRSLALSLLAILALIAPPAHLVASRNLAHTAVEFHQSPEVKTAAMQGTTLRVMFMGVTTILLDDGETAIMTDGFFSRPGRTATLLRKISPNQNRITYALSRAGVNRLAAVMTAHSHHDHAMDSPEVARRTGALLIGSQSTANIARGVNFPEDRICVIRGGETFSFGRFNIKVIKSLHAPGGFFMGDIAAPLRPPARVGRYREGGSYSYLIEHDGQRILIQASANFCPGFLRDVRANIVFLGMGKLGKQKESFINRYWQEVVQATDAKVIIPIHWDDFTRPLNLPLQPLPHLLDDFDNAMRTIRRLAAANHVNVRLLSPFEAVNISELSR
jgi:L-ascorbate metabolism protein UlaG (beta-lactamase superfamily)